MTALISDELADQVADVLGLCDRDDGWQNLSEEEKDAVCTTAHWAHNERERLAALEQLVRYSNSSADGLPARMWGHGGVVGVICAGAGRHNGASVRGKVFSIVANLLDGPEHHWPHIFRAVSEDLIEATADSYPAELQCKALWALGIFTRKRSTLALMHQTNERLNNAIVDRFQAARRSANDGFDQWDRQHFGEAVGILSAAAARRRPEPINN